MVEKQLLKRATCYFCFTMWALTLIVCTVIIATVASEPRKSYWVDGYEMDHKTARLDACAVHCSAGGKARDKKIGHVNVSCHPSSRAF